MIHETEENQPILKSIIEKCHEQHIKERTTKYKRYLSTYMYTYSFDYVTAKEYLRDRKINVTVEERSLIDSWVLPIEKYRLAKELAL